MHVYIGATPAPIQMPSPCPPAPPQSVFLDYAAALLQRTNEVTGAQYRYDPSILGWCARPGGGGGGWAA